MVTWYRGHSSQRKPQTFEEEESSWPGACREVTRSFQEPRQQQDIKRAFAARNLLLKTSPLLLTSYVTSGLVHGRLNIVSPPPPKRSTP